MIGCLPTQAIAFEWKTGFIRQLVGAKRARVRRQFATPRLSPLGLPRMTSLGAATDAARPDPDLPTPPLWEKIWLQIRGRDGLE